MSITGRTSVWNISVMDLRGKNPVPLPSGGAKCRGEPAGSAAFLTWGGLLCSAARWGMMDPGSEMEGRAWLPSQDWHPRVGEATSHKDLCPGKRQVTQGTARALNIRVSHCWNVLLVICLMRREKLAGIFLCLAAVWMARRAVIPCRLPCPAIPALQSTSGVFLCQESAPWSTSGGGSLGGCSQGRAHTKFMLMLALQKGSCLHNFNLGLNLNTKMQRLGAQGIAQPSSPVAAQPALPLARKKLLFPLDSGPAWNNNTSKPSLAQHNEAALSIPRCAEGKCPVCPFLMLPFQMWSGRELVASQEILDFLETLWISLPVRGKQFGCPASCSVGLKQLESAVCCREGMTHQER